MWHVLHRRMGRLLPGIPQGLGKSSDWSEVNLSPQGQPSKQAGTHARLPLPLTLCVCAGVGVCVGASASGLPPVHPEAAAQCHQSPP